MVPGPGHMLHHLIIICMKVVLSFLNPYLIDEETRSQTGKAAFFKGTELVTRET